LQLLGAKISPVVMSDKKRYGFKLEPHLHDGSYHGTNVSSTSTSSVASPGSDVKEKSKIKPIILFCKDEQEQKIWISDIRDAINNLAEKSDAMQKRKEEARLAKKKKATLRLKPRPDQSQSQLAGALQTRVSSGSFSRSETFSNDRTSQSSPTPHEIHTPRETASPLSPSTQIGVTESEDSVNPPRRSSF